MKQILITGGAGFIGSHLTEALLARGDRVVVIDDESTGSMSNLSGAKEHKNLTIIAGSVSDTDLIRETTANADEVYHLAAAVGVALIANKPIETIERNIFPTEMLLTNLRELIKQGKRIKFFLASTSEVYGKNPKETWCEDDDLVFGSTTRPRWSYGASKAIDEFLALASYREYGLPVVVARFFNVVGPRQTGTYGMVLPRFVDAALENRPLVVHDDGRQIRCFAHVNDVISAVTQLMTTDSAVGSVYNIGSDQPISILDLAGKVIAAADSKSTIEFQTYAKAYDEDFEDIRRRVPDLARLRAAINYEPEYDLDGIIRTVIAAKRQ